MIIVFISLVVVLLLLNAFFVLAEFSTVKIRPTHMEALADAGNRKAKRVRHIQGRLDEYLSVCQVGITLASIGLGFVGEPAFAALIKPLVAFAGGPFAREAVAHGIAISAGYILISYLHIVIGELIPKSMALRLTEKSALLIAAPLMAFRHLFFVPIWILNATVNATLRLFRFPANATEARHSEEEIRIILEQSHSGGQMSFRRLLYMENILDFGDLKARNAMQAKSRVRSLRLGATQAEIDALIGQYRFSRYPLLTGGADVPIGCIHIKDLYLAQRQGKPVIDLAAFARPCLIVYEDDPLEQLLFNMQRKGMHMALVRDKNKQFSGIVTLEDAIEEVIGTIEEEYPLETTVRLTDTLSAERILLDVKGASISSAVHNALSCLPPESLPMHLKAIMARIIQREQQGGSYVGRGVAIPHARLSGLKIPIVVIARLREPFPAPFGNEAVSLLFILLTPIDEPRIHQILLSHIAGIIESGFVETKLASVSSSAEFLEAISNAEQIALS